MLEVRGLVKRYAMPRGTAPAVRNIGFSVAAGEFFTLLGPSGCGKTTTLRCVAGLETPDEGEIRIGGEIVFSAAARIEVPVHRRDIAMVFQSYAIWPHMTVRENVSFPLEAMRVRADDAELRIDHALNMVGLLGFADRSATQLSGGQQQRVAVARAIAKDANLLLLDEPLSNLDATLRLQMRHELRALQRDLGLTAIYVTHDQEEALSLSDRVAVMRDGAIVEIGAPLDLYLRPRDTFTASFIGQADLLPCTVGGMAGNNIAVDSRIGRVHAAVYPHRIDRVEALLLIRPEHIAIAAAAEVEADDGDPNVYQGQVVSTVFSGRTVEYVVAVGEHRMRVQALSTAVLREGTDVLLHIPPERCVVMERPREALSSTGGGTAWGR